MSLIKTSSKVLAGLAVVIVLLIGAIYLTGGIKQLTAPFRGETQEKELTEADGNYRIAAYEEFYDLNAQIEAKEIEICAMKSNTSLPVDQRETNVLALTNKRTELVAEYNADASKTDTRAKFKASDLPYTIEKEAPSC